MRTEGQRPIKEGLRDGGLALLLWELRGGDPTALALACDRACRILLGDGD